jgi:alkyl sulfatase BDS1-like metallo-beta-lactamase superfamily hydrolase
MKKAIIVLSMISTVSLNAFAAQHEHDRLSVDYHGKAATPATAAHNTEIAQSLNFKDKNAFTRFNQNRIAEFDQATEDILRVEFSFISETLPD